MSTRHIILVGLTERQCRFLGQAVEYFAEQIENDETCTVPEKAMWGRLSRKLLAAPRITETSIERLLFAAGNLLDDPDSVRDFNLKPAMPAVAALEATLEKE